MVYVKVSISLNICSNHLEEKGILWRKYWGCLHTHKIGRPIIGTNKFSPFFGENLHYALVQQFDASYKDIGC